MLKIKRITSFMVAISLFCSIALCGCGEEESEDVLSAESISVIEMASIDELKQVNTASLGGRLTIYRIADQYYAYFPSTNTIEALTAPTEYDWETAEVVDSLYSNTFIKDGQEYVISERTVDTIEVFSSAVDSRMQYITRELDNCNANMVVNNTESLTEYREQLLIEMDKLLGYQSEISQELLTIFNQLDPETQTELARRISVLMDKSFVGVVKQYSYVQNNNIATENTIAHLESVIATQEQVINELTEKYETLEQVLVEKRVEFDNIADIVDTPEFKEIIATLDTRVDSYVTDCADKYKELDTKIKALESLYETVSNVNNDEYKDVLQQLRTEYQTINNTKTEIEKQIEYYTELRGTDSNSDIDEIIAEELNKQQDQLDLLNEIINSSNLKDIDDLAQKQDNLYEYIKNIENIQNNIENTVTKTQYEEIKNIKTQIETLQSGESKDDLLAKITALEEQTKLSLEEIKALVEKDDLNNAVTTLNELLAEQGEKIKEQDDFYKELINTTTEQVQNDIINTLYISISEQEDKLSNEKEALEALIFASDEELKNILTELMKDADSDLQDDIKKVSDLLGTESEELNAAIAELEKKLNSSVGSTEQILESNKAAFEALIAEKTSALKQEINGVIANKDTETQNKINDVLNTIAEGDDSQGKALDKAVSDLKILLDTKIGLTEDKISDEKTALETLVSSGDAKTKEDIQKIIDELDADTQTKINNIISSVPDKQAFDDTVALLKSDIAEAETNLETNRGTLDTLSSDINTLKANQSQNSSDILDIQSNQDKTDADIAEIKQNQDSTNTDIERLQEGQTETKKDVTDLSTLLGSLTDEHNETIGKVGTLSLNLTDLKQAYNQFIENRYATTETNLTSLTNQYNSYAESNTTRVEKAEADIISVTNAYNTLADNYNQYVTDNNTRISEVESMLNLTRLSLKEDIDALTTYKQLNTATVSATKQTADKNAEDIADLMAHDTQTDSKIQTLEQAVAALQQSGGTTELENRVSTLEAFKTSATSDISELETKINTEVGNLTGTITDNYNTLNTEISSLKTAVSDIRSTLDSHTGQLSTLSTKVTDLEADISALSTEIDELSDKIDDLIANPYELPAASASILGGVKVDGSTITVDPDGTLHVLVGYNTLDEFYPIGTVYPIASEIKDRIKPYCVQTTATTTTTQQSKTVSTEKYQVAKGYTYTKVVVSAVKCKDCGYVEGYSTPSTQTSITEAEYNAGTYSFTWYEYRNDCERCSGPVHYTGEIIYTRDATGYNYGYKYTNPFTNEVVDVYPLTSAGPSTVTVTGDVTTTTYNISSSLNSVQLQKLKDAGIITTTTNATTYKKQLYNHTGNKKWVYCGIPTIPTTSV